MRNNLILYNVKEEIEEDPTALVKTFIQRKLHLDPSRIVLERAHHLGNPKSDNRRQARGAEPASSQSRSLIASIRRSARELKGTNYGIAEQFRKEIHERRKVLYPILKKARKAANKA